MSDLDEHPHPHRLRVPISEFDWTIGPDQASVTLVEYIDYECRHCRAFAPVLKRLQRKHRDFLRVAVRNFPSVSSHPHAMEAALAAEAAGRQGKFWEMHDRLIEEDAQLDPESILDYARDTGLDITRFQEDINDPELREEIQEEKSKGLRSGVNGTPTLFINGDRYDGDRDLDSLSEAVTAAAKSS